MDDRELLEKAALAAWYEIFGDIHPSDGLNVLINGRIHLRRPLTDDGDALRLAVKLRMGVDPWGAGACAVVFTGKDMQQVREPHYGDDAERATRRAIVRAAAAIGAERKGG